MDYQNQQTENGKSTECCMFPLEHQQLCNENRGTNLHPLSRLFAGLDAESERLRKKAEGRLTVLEEYRDGFPTSSPSVAKKAAACIAMLIHGSAATTRNTDRVLSLLQDYRVFVPARGGDSYVSLLQLHVLLQDNYKDSYLLKFLNLTIGEHGSQSMTIAI